MRAGLRLRRARAPCAAAGDHVAAAGREDPDDGVLGLGGEVASAGSTVSVRRRSMIRSCEGSWSAVSCTWWLKSERMRCTVSEPIATAKRAQDHERQQRRDAREADADRQPVEARRQSRAGALHGARSLRAKDVAGSPDRVQQARLALGLELAAQVRDEHLDRVRRGEGVIAPHLVEQALAGDHDALVAHQVLEQLELALGQLDRALAARDLVRVGVEQQIADAQRRGAAWRAPAQQRAHPREQKGACSGIVYSRAIACAMSACTLSTSLKSRSLL